MIFDYFILTLQFLLPKRFLTVCVGFLAEIRWPLFKNAFIRWFIRSYKVNMQEAVHERAEDYPCFNDFFIRHLKPNARTFAQSPIISPVDGFVSEIGLINSDQILQAKNHFYTIHELLGARDINLSQQFTNGSFATLYLSPSDYHRVHMPITGTVKQMIYIPGKLFSVQPATTRMIPKLFAQNERVVVFFETDVGPMAMILVGATIVGKININWHGDILRSSDIQEFSYPTPKTLQQGEEMGYFKLGSTVILLFAGSNFTWDKQLKNGVKISLGQNLIQ